MFNQSKSYLLITAAFLLSSCLADQAVELESRAIAIDQSAVGAAGPQSASVIAAAEQKVSLTYVTITAATPAGGVVNATRQDATPLTSGSGFVISKDGYVVTAAHVAVNKGNEISARAANGRVYAGTVEATFKENDMALIKLRKFDGQAVKPAAPACTAPGELVFTLGKPRGKGDTARIGTMKSLHFGRPVTYGEFGYPDAMVLTMGTQRGESGGPVFNAQGQLIGMVVSTLSNAAGQSINMAHAIPANRIGKFICGLGKCGPGWQAVAAKPVDSCG